MLLKQTPEEIPTINLTPMLDVVFNLLVFFLAGTKFIEMENQLPVDLPQVSQAGPLVSPPSRRVVTITRDGRLWLDGKETSPEQLTADLARARAEYPGLAVLVKGDADGRFQTVADALSAVTRAGIAETAIAVRVEDGNGVRR